MQLNFQPLLIITRSWLYLSLFLIITTLTILPWSIVSYLKLYTVLIPPELNHVVEPRVNYVNGKPFIMVELPLPGPGAGAGSKTTAAQPGTTSPSTANSASEIWIEFQLQHHQPPPSLFNNLHWVNYRLMIIDDEMWVSKFVPTLAKFHSGSGSGSSWGASVVRTTLEQESSNRELLETTTAAAIENVWSLSQDIKIDPLLAEACLVKKDLEILTAKRNSVNSVIAYQYDRLYVYPDPHPAAISTSRQWFFIRFFQYVLSFFYTFTAVGGVSATTRTTTNTFKIPISDSIQSLPIPQSPHRLILEFDSRNLIIPSISIHVVNVFKNLRFFMYNYYWYCFIIGVVLFDIVGVCMALLVAVWVLYKFGATAAEAPSQPAIKIKREPILDQDVYDEDDYNTNTNTSHLLDNLDELTR